MPLSSKAKKVVEIAKETHNKMPNVPEVKESIAMANFVAKLKENKIAYTGWFNIDDEIRKLYECESWFWMIRRLRNSPSYWN